MTNKGMAALLISAVLLESFVPIARADDFFARQRHRKRPRPDLPAIANDAATTAESVPSARTPAAPAKPGNPGVGIQVMIESQSTTTTIPVAPPPPPIPSGARPAPPVVTFPAAQPVAPGPSFAIPAAPAPAPESPMMPMARSRPQWKTAALASAGLLGSSYVLSVLLGGISYGAFTDGQWGWFVPVAGPVLVMSGACGNPSGCYFKGLFTYTTGVLTTLSTLSGLTMGIISLVGYRHSGKPDGIAQSLRILPSAARDSTGLVIVGAF